MIKVQRKGPPHWQVKLLLWNDNAYHTLRANDTPGSEPRTLWTQSLQPCERPLSLSWFYVQQSWAHRVGRLAARPTGKLQSWDSNPDLPNIKAPVLKQVSWTALFFVLIAMWRGLRQRRGSDECLRLQNSMPALGNSFLAPCWLQMLIRKAPFIPSCPLPSSWDLKPLLRAISLWTKGCYPHLPLTWF